MWSGNCSLHSGGMFMRRIAATVIFLAFLPCGMLAARLMLRDGSVVVGEFLRGSPDTIVFRDSSGVEQRFDINQVQSIDFGRSAPDRDRYQERDWNDASGQPPAAQPPRSADLHAVLQPGTQISVRTGQLIDSRDNWQGIAYPATIVQDVLSNDGRVVIPRGAPASMVIRQVGQGPLGGANLVLDLDTVQIDGRGYHVASTDVVGNNGVGANRRTAEMVGGGAALGTLLGALA